MAMKSLNQMRALFKEPQLLHKWTVEVPTWPTAASPSNPDIIFMVTSTALPTAQEEFVKIQMGGFSFNYNGKTDRNGEIDWNFVENTDGDILKYFFIDYANAKQNFKSKDDITLMSKDSKDLIAPIVNMNMYAADGKTLTKQVQLLNCLFKPATSGELGQEAEVLKATVNVAFDSYIWIKK